MATTAKILSTQTRGESILIAGTATGNTLVHTGPTSTTTFQDVWLKIVNTSATVTYNYTVEVGIAGTQTVIAFGQITPLQGSAYEKFRIQGNATAPIVNVYASTTNVLRVSGEIIEITP